MIETVFIIWGVGMVGYIIINKNTSFKDKHRCNVRREIIKLKKFNNHVNENSKNSFK
jgi:hypothetical protein